MTTSTDQDGVPQTAADALSRMHTDLDYFTSADLHALGTGIQGQVLKELARISARVSAIQGAVLAVFDAAGGPEEAGCATVSTWLANHAQATKGAARAQRRWSRTLQAHPAVAGAMARPYGFSSPLVGSTVEPMVVMARVPMTAVAGPASSASASVDAFGLGLEASDGPPYPAGAVVMGLELLHAARAAARLETAIVFEDSILMIPYSKRRVDIHGSRGGGVAHPRTKDTGRSYGRRREDRMLAKQPESHEERRQERQHGDQSGDQEQQDQPDHGGEDDRRAHRNRDFPSLETQG